MKRLLFLLFLPILLFGQQGGDRRFDTIRVKGVVYSDGTRQTTAAFGTGTGGGYINSSAGAMKISQYVTIGMNQITFPTVDTTDYTVVGIVKNDTTNTIGIPVFYDTSYNKTYFRLESPINGTFEGAVIYAIDTSSYTSGTHDTITIAGVTGALDTIRSGINIIAARNNDSVYTVSADTTAGNSKLATQAYVLNHSNTSTFADSGNFAKLNQGNIFTQPNAFRQTLTVGQSQAVNGTINIRNSTNNSNLALTPSIPSTNIVVTLPSTTGTILVNTDTSALRTSFLSQVLKNADSTSQRNNSNLLYVAKTDSDYITTGKIKDDAVTEGKIVDSIQIGYSGVSGMILGSGGADSIYSTTTPVTMLDTTASNHFTTETDAHNLANATGTLSAARLPLSGVTAGTYSSIGGTIDAYGRFTFAESGTGGGGGTSSGVNGIDTIYANKFTDTLTSTGNIKAHYTISLVPKSSTRIAHPTTSSVLSAWLTKDTAYVTRLDTVGGNQIYYWEVNTDSISPPTAFTATPYEGDSIALSWSRPINNALSTNATLSRYIITYNDTGFVSSPSLITNTRTTTAGKDTISNLATLVDTLDELATTDTLFCQIFSETVDGFYSSTGAWSQDTGFTSTSGTTWTPLDLDSLSAWYDIQSLTVNGNPIYDSVAILPDSSGNNYFLTSKDNHKPIVYTDGGLKYLQFRRTDTTYMIDTSRVSSIMNGDGKKVSVFIAFRGDTVLNTNQRDIFGFNNYGTNGSGYWGKLYRNVSGNNKYSIVQNTLYRTPSGNDTSKTNYYGMTDLDSSNMVSGINILEFILESDSMKIAFNSDTTIVGNWNNPWSIDTSLTKTINRFMIGAHWTSGSALPNNGINARYYEMIICKGVETEANRIKIREYFDNLYSTPYVP